MTNKQIIKFSKLWSKANDYYIKMMKGNHLHFPEPFLKDLIKSKFGLTDINPGSYDFDGEIELKSVTKAGGNTPYQFSERNCKRIYYCEILNNEVHVYIIAKAKVASIRAIIRRKHSEFKKRMWNYSFANVTTGKYKGRKKNVFYLSNASWKY